MQKSVSGICKKRVSTKTAQKLIKKSDPIFIHFKEAEKLYQRDLKAEAAQLLLAEKDYLDFYQH